MWAPRAAFRIGARPCSCLLRAANGCSAPRDRRWKRLAANSAVTTFTGLSGLAALRYLYTFAHYSGVSCTGTPVHTLTGLRVGSELRARHSMNCNNNATTCATIVPQVRPTTSARRTALQDCSCARPAAAIDGCRRSFGTAGRHCS
jgi:hypothetical protein